MFSLDKEESEKLSKWLNSLTPAPEGAIGGRITYSFTPTNLGTVIKVKDSITQEEIDLTNYQNW